MTIQQSKLTNLTLDDINKLLFKEEKEKYITDQETLQKKLQDIARGVKSGQTISDMQFNSFFSKDQIEAGDQTKRDEFKSLLEAIIKGNKKAEDYAKEIIPVSEPVTPKSSEKSAEKEEPKPPKPATPAAPAAPKETKGNLNLYTALILMHSYKNAGKDNNEKEVKKLLDTYKDLKTEEDIISKIIHNFEQLIAGKEECNVEQEVVKRKYAFVNDVAKNEFLGFVEEYKKFKYTGDSEEYLKNKEELIKRYILDNPIRSYRQQLVLMGTPPEEVEKISISEVIELAGSAEKSAIGGFFYNSSKNDAKECASQYFPGEHIISTEQVFEVFLAKNLEILKEFDEFKNINPPDVFKEKAREIFKTNGPAFQQKIIVETIKKLKAIKEKGLALVTVQAKGGGCSAQNADAKGVEAGIKPADPAKIEPLADRQATAYYNAKETLAILENNLKIKLDGDNVDDDSIKRFFPVAVPRDSIEKMIKALDKKFRDINEEYNRKIKLAATAEAKTTLDTERSTKLEEVKRQYFEANGLTRLGAKSNVYVCYDKTNNGIAYAMTGGRTDIDASVKEIVEHNASREDVEQYCDFVSSKNKQEKILACLKHNTQFGFGGNGKEHKMSEALGIIKAGGSCVEALAKLSSTKTFLLFGACNRQSFMDNYFTNKPEMRAKLFAEVSPPVDDKDKKAIVGMINKSPFLAPLYKTYCEGLEKNVDKTKSTPLTGQIANSKQLV